MTKRVIVIGGGLAGMTASLSAAEQGADVVLVARGGLATGSNSALSNGMFAGPGADYTGGEYVEDTLRIGKHLNTRWMVEQLAEEAPDAFSWAERFGLRWRVRKPFHIFAEERPDVIRGVQMMRVLSDAVLREPRIETVAGCHVNEILRREGRAVGVSGRDRGGRRIALGARAVVLATGGAGALYASSDNHPGALGQGYALAARTGLELLDLEFVQFYPILLKGDGGTSLMIYPPYPPEARIVNERGENLLEKYEIGDLSHAVREKRDEFSASLVREGSTYADFTKIRETAWSRYSLAILARTKFGLRTAPVPISPGAHFCMGGVCTDRRGATSLPGLFACGEVVGGLHGANRRGGNALSECLVFGRRAGREAALAAHREGGSFVPEDASDDSSAASHRRRGRPGEAKALRVRLRRIAWERAGIVRSEEGLRRGEEELRTWQKEFQEGLGRAMPRSPLARDMEDAALVLGGILTASLARRENRGSFLREDLPTSATEIAPVHSVLAFDPREERLVLRPGRPEGTEAV